MIKLTKKQDKARTAFINNVRSVIAGNIYLELETNDYEYVGPKNNERLLLSATVYFAPSFSVKAGKQLFRRFKADMHKLDPKTSVMQGCPDDPEDGDHITVTKEI